MARKLVAAGVNLIRSPQDLDNATNWLQWRMTVSANQIVAPDGSISADKLTEAALTDFHYLQHLASGCLVVPTKAYTASAYLQMGTQRYVALYVGTNVAPGGVAYAIFDLQNHVVSATYTDSTFSSVSGAMDADANGFYRCSLTLTSNVTDALHPTLIESTDGLTITSYLGDVSKYYYAWGIQFEPGTTPSAYFNPSFARVAIGLKNLTVSSEDWSEAHWTKGTGVTATANSLDVAPPAAFPNAAITKVVYDGSGTISAQRIGQSALNSILGGQFYTVAYWIRVSSGSHVFNLFRGLVFGNVTVTTTWQRMLGTAIANANGVLVRVSGDGSDNTAVTFYVTRAQSGESSGDFPYVKTTSVTDKINNPTRKFVSGRVAKSGRVAA